MCSLLQTVHLDPRSKHIDKMAPTTFHPFALLPYELRCQIWTYTLIPQTIPLDYFMCVHVLGPRPAPTILQINHESRTFALKSYHLIAVQRSIYPYIYVEDPGTDVGFIYFNPRLDVFFFHAGWFHYYFEARMLDEWFEGLKRKDGVRVLMGTGGTEEGRGGEIRENMERWLAAAKGRKEERLRIGVAMLEGLEIVD